MKIDVLPNSDVVAQDVAKFIVAEARSAIPAARAVQLCGEWRTQALAHVACPRQRKHPVE
ncbi:MAG TPA: hypothetical protein VGP76_03030 [Planctomycetaceae bacterium]|jgi:hypothetical protein|nr:hypothetical protein [Planctomycetaceae bacterium]